MEETFNRRQTASLDRLAEKDNRLRSLAAELNSKQVVRIHDNTSKTRLSLLFYAIVGNAMMISKQNLELLEVFNLSFGEIEETLHK